jgi:hypothetical protein
MDDAVGERGRAMDLHFCDLCNESVPQSDLDAGRAAMRKGRVVCARCDSAMSQAGEGLAREHGGPAAIPPPAGVLHAQGIIPESAPSSTPAPVPTAAAPLGAPSPSAAIAVALASVAILAALCVSVYVFDGLHEAEESRALESIESSARLERAERAIGSRLDSGAAEMRSAAEGLRNDLIDLRARAEELRGIEQTRATNTASEIKDLQERIAELASQWNEVERHGEDLADLRRDLAGLTASLGALEGRLAAAESARLAMPVAPAAAVVEEEPGWKLMLPGLASPSPSRRWEAVQALGTSGDPAVAEHLAPMLKDPDIFVRMATARFLGDLRAVLGVPALIDALEDVEPSVREAAYIALRVITGQEIDFDPIAKDSERARRVKAWRDWWDEHADELLGRARSS